MRTAVLLAVLAGGAALIVVAVHGGRRVLHVPGDYPSIQAALDAAPPGGTVVVAAGAYPEGIDFKGRAVAVVAASGRYRPRLLGPAGGYAVRFASGETWRARLQGFVIEATAGILVRGASPTIKDNRIVGPGPRASRPGNGIRCLDGAAPVVLGNRVSGFTAGSAIHCRGASPEIRRNTLIGNRAARGGAIACVNCRSRIVGNRLLHNRAVCGGAIHIAGGSARLESNLIALNRADLGGGLHVAGAAVAAAHETLAQNRAGVGGGLALRGGAATLTSCIVWGNRAPLGPALHAPEGRLRVAFSDVEGGWRGAGNFEAEPRFIAPTGDDFHLRADSPCRGAGRRPGADFDFELNPRRLDGRVDLGADEFYPQLYRTLVAGAPHLRVVGEPGSLVELGVSEHMRPYPQKSDAGDSIFIDPPLNIVPLYRLPPGGWVTRPLALPPGVSPRGVVYLQAAVNGRMTNLMRFPP